MLLHIPEQIASMTSISDVRDHAEISSTLWNVASESLGSVTAESLGWSQRSSFGNCCQVYGSFSRLFTKKKHCHLASSLQSRFSWQSCGRVSRQALGLPDVDPLLASLMVPQRVVGFQDRASSQRSTCQDFDEWCRARWSRLPHWMHT